jgi:hypothetical protein
MLVGGLSEMLAGWLWQCESACTLHTSAATRFTQIQRERTREMRLPGVSFRRGAVASQLRKEHPALLPLCPSQARLNAAKTYSKRPDETNRLACAGLVRTAMDGAVR